MLELFEEFVPQKLCYRLILKYVSTISYAFHTKLRITAMTTTGKNSFIQPQNLFKDVILHNVKFFEQ